MLDVITFTMKWMFLSEALGHQRLNSLAYDLGSIVAKHFFRLRINELDDPFFINNDDCIWGRFQKTAELLFCKHVLRDIPGNANNTGYPPIPIHDRHFSCRKPAWLSIRSRIIFNPVNQR